MLEQLTLADFTPHLETKFRLDLPGGEGFDVELIEAVGVGGTPSHREPFSLIFLGPAEPILPQATYKLRHDAMGELTLFLVPMGPKGNGIHYESIFT